MRLLRAYAPSDAGQRVVVEQGFGCAVEVTGTLVASQGKGQSVEMQVDSITVVGWVDDPDTSNPNISVDMFHTLTYRAARRLPALRVA